MTDLETGLQEHGPHESFDNVHREAHRRAYLRDYLIHNLDGYDPRYEIKTRSEQPFWPPIQRLSDFPDDTFVSSPLIGFTEVPDGKVLVRQTLKTNSRQAGLWRVPWEERHELSTGGFYAFLGLYDFWGQIAVVDTRVRPLQNVPAFNLLTRDNAQIHVKYSLFYQVKRDPAGALIGLKDFNLATLLETDAYIRDLIGDLTLDQLSDIGKVDGEGRALTPYQYNLAENRTFEKIEPFGIDVLGMYLTEADIPPHLQQSITGRITKEQDMLGEVREAELEVTRANHLATAANVYDGNPTTKWLRDHDALQDVTQEGRHRITFLPDKEGLAGMVRSMMGYKSPEDSE